jgi:hypothetical protein
MPNSIGIQNKFITRSPKRKYKREYKGSDLKNNRLPIEIK